MKAWPASPSLYWAGCWEALEGGRACKGALFFLSSVAARVSRAAVAHRPGGPGTPG
jgi:hypothetical protein